MSTDEFTDAVIAVIADNEEIIITVLVAAHQSLAVFLGTTQAEHIRFDAYIAEIFLGCGPEIEIRIFHENAIPAAVIVHDAMIIRNAIPSAGVLLEFLLIENLTRLRSRDYRGGRRTGGEN